MLETAGTARQPDGIGVYTRELERALLGQGADVRRVGMRGDFHARSLHYPLPWRLAAAATSTLHVAMPFAASIEREIDVYHATDYVVPRFANTPVVVTLHDAIPLAHPQWANPRLRNAKNRLLRRFAESATLVIAISHAAIPELVEHYAIARDRIRVVPLGVDAQWHLPPAAAAAASLASRGVHPGYFLHVGTLQPRKNLDALIDAYERLPHAVRARRQLIVVGKYGWAAEALRERLVSLRSADRVLWLEYVDAEALRALYHGARAFVFPSLAEGFGLPVVEALAAGVPVIASDLPALREIAQGHARFVSPHRIDDLVDAMLEQDRAPHDAALVSARQRHVRQFTWQACAARTLDVYREAIS